MKCVGCGGIPTLCDKCNQETCANGQEDIEEQILANVERIINERKAYLVKRTSEPMSYKIKNQFYARINELKELIATLKGRMKT
jgi:hypothetical protein